MKHEQQRKFDSLRRVQDFLDAHAAEVGALKDSEGRKQLDSAVTALTLHGNDQGTANLEMAGQLSLEKSLATALRLKHMQPIAVFARAKLRGVPDFAAIVKSGSGLESRPLVRAARAMATAAAPHAAALERGGFPANTIAELGAAADAVEATGTARANTRVRRIGATKGVAEEVRRGREAVAMLNAVISRQFVGDKTFLAAWRAAYRVVHKTGAVRAIESTPAGQTVAAA